MKKRINIICLSSITLMALIQISCQTLPYQPYARDVKKRADAGGVIALKTDHREEDLAKAKSMMERNCNGAGVRILEEGEVVVGEKTNSRSDQNTYQNSVYGTSPSGFVSAFAAPPTTNTQSGESTTTQIKEWQISYECVKNEAAKTAKSDENSKSQRKK